MEQDNKIIKVKCDCGKIITIDLTEEYLSWEIVETDEREMGDERLNEAVLEVECEECKKTIYITLHVWEYPEGVENMHEIEVDGGTLINGCDDLGSLVLDDNDSDYQDTDDDDSDGYDPDLDEK